MIYLSKSDMGPFKEPWGKKPLNLENIELANEGFSHIASDILIYCKHVQIETLLVLVPQQIPNIVPRRVNSAGCLLWAETWHGKSIIGTQDFSFYRIKKNKKI